MKEEKSMKVFREGADVDKAVKTYGDMLLKVCITVLCNRYDAEEVVQETFIAYMMYEKEFQNEEHRKAWLLRVAINKSKNVLRFHRIHSYVDLDSIKEMVAAEEHETLNEILQLPLKLRTAIHLHYYDGYTCKEIGKIIGTSEAAVKKRLQKGRERLKEILGGEE